MSRLRRFSLPTLVFAAAVFICGKLLLTPVKTFRSGASRLWILGIDRRDLKVAGHGSIGSALMGLSSRLIRRAPWTSPTPDGMLSADLAVLSLVAIAAWLVSFWLWRRTQYRLRYSLRGLLLATFVIAIPMGWIARQIYDWRREQFWIGELDNVNIQIDTNDYADLYQNRLGTSLSSVTVEPCDFPEWLRRLSPDRLRPLFRRVKCIEVKSWVTLRKRAFESVLEAALHEMQLVRSLHVGRDCGFQLLDASAFANIESLAIDDPIDDRMLQVIAALPRLRSLKLIGSNVSDGGFDCLADCRHLEKLSIWSVFASWNRTHSEVHHA